MKWRQAKKVIKLDGLGKTKKRLSCYHKIKGKQWDKYFIYFDRLNPGFLKQCNELMYGNEIKNDS